MGDNGNNGINEAWKPMLDVLPKEFHNLVIPVIKSWDDSANSKIAEVNAKLAKYDGYREFVEHNIDPAYAKSAVLLANRLESDAESLVKEINETWKLGLITPEEAQALRQSDPDDFSLLEADDLADHPALAEVKQQLQKIQTEAERQREQEEQEAAIEEFEASLDALESEYTNPDREGGPLPFNRMFVTALMTSGLSGEDAVKQYHETLASAGLSLGTTTTDNNSNDQDAPAVMGSGGSAGSGTPDGSVNVGSLSKNDLQDTVEQMLERSLGNGQ